jgi:UDP-N-acetylglucosamine--N-acetylmuramyl-(pentapeptide) pyrophosphoryl-undecaprenol N-acetylglucosamine transferase
MTKRAVIAAGGTGGHIFPALAIADELKKQNFEILFIGNSKSMEEKLAERADVKFSGIDVQKLYRKFTFAHLKFPFKLYSSIKECKSIIDKFKPDIFVGTGGFVSGPAGYAAYKKNIPIFLLEQNSYPGITTRILSKYAEKVFLGSKSAKQFLKNAETTFSGNPINTNVINEKKHLDLKKIGLREDSTKFFVFGGSQGSAILNKAVFSILDNILDKNIEIIWQIGKYGYSEYSKKLIDKKGVHFFEFSNEMGKIYNSVDFILSRAGALSLAETETKKIPSIIIPLPSSAGNHQFYNAMELKYKSVAEVINQKEIGTLLEPAIFFMKDNFEEIKKKFVNSKHLNAAENIVKEILEIA